MILDIILDSPDGYEIFHFFSRLVLQISVDKREWGGRSDWNVDDVPTLLILASFVDLELVL